MLFYTGLLFLVIAVSLDGFGVGVTYGMRRIRVPLIALLIIMLCSGIMVLVAMTIGNIISSFISPNIAEMLGGFILISIGCFSLYNISRPRREAEVESSSTEKRQNTISTVLTTPDKADLDRSGTISANEAVLLGSALALDAFGAGIGAAMLGYSPILTAVLIALMSGSFVFCGIKTGIFLSKNRYLKRMTYIPPLLLIALGIFNIVS
ncbi:putative sporulation protein YtaF [Virgibacillus natechei]|uniref:Sporulation protein YtaF n=1 Tax=Virgibacillus natechei TaxID=1216297 RepID=A0ABS4INE9_9BACI|nr:sporulation membrane protein YtaF [Virgibacillus natechei]MBP1971529.1 putative sporulation protein YtaF [Virgibacillus natechei]UZD12000.1 sporulation membrane protein YtaF [Virgibacillus natechei]